MERNRACVVPPRIAQKEQMPLSLVDFLSDAVRIAAEGVCDGLPVVYWCLELA